MTDHDDFKKALQQAIQPNDELTSRTLAGVESRLKATSQPTLMGDMFSLGWSTLTALLGTTLSSTHISADRLPTAMFDEQPHRKDADGE